MYDEMRKLNAELRRVRRQRVSDRELLTRYLAALMFNRHQIPPWEHALLNEADITIKVFRHLLTALSGDPPRLPMPIE